MLKFSINQKILKANSTFDTNLFVFNEHSNTFNMYQTVHAHKKLYAALTACLLIAAVSLSFQNSPFSPLDKLDSLTELEDTIPTRPEESTKGMNIKDFDQMIQHIDQEMLKINRHLNTVDYEKIHGEINAALNRVNLDKINRDMDMAMQDINVAKIEQGVTAALKQIDWNKVDGSVKQALQEAKKEIEKINLSQVKKELTAAKTELEKSKRDLKKIDADEILKYANQSITQAREELMLTREMFNEMEKDGLINQQRGFNIELCKNILTINGRVQPAAIRDKYKTYLKRDHFQITISK